MSNQLQQLRRECRRSGDGSGLVARIPYAAWLGMRIRLTPRPEVGLADGDIVFQLPFRDDLVGNTRLPALHGGVISGFMENAALLHLLLVLPDADASPRTPKSIDFSIDYLNSARAQDLSARCMVERIGRRVAQLQIRCTQTLHGNTAAVSPRSARDIAVARAHLLLDQTE